jgi:hypothetical protein
MMLCTGFVALQLMLRRTWRAAAGNPNNEKSVAGEALSLSASYCFHKFCANRRTWSAAVLANRTHDYTDYFK